MDKPEVDFTGLVARRPIDQKSTSRNPRSTVGTITEIHYCTAVRSYACRRRTHCSRGGRIQAQTIPADRRLRAHDGRGHALPGPFPVVRRKGEHQIFIDELRLRATRARSSTVASRERPPAGEEAFKHTIEVVIDRLVVRDGMRHQRLTDFTRPRCCACPSMASSCQ